MLPPLATESAPTSLPSTKPAQHSVANCAFLLFSCPKEMEVDKPTRVSILVAPEFTDSVKSKLRGLDICKAGDTCELPMSQICADGYAEVGSTKIWKIDISPDMTVNLDAGNFASQPLFSITDFDARTSVVPLSWEITPHDFGTQNISFSIFSRENGKASAPVTLSGDMFQTVTVTGKEKEAVHKVAAVVGEGFDFTLGKIVEILLGAVVTAVAGAYLKKKWPHMFGAPDKT